MKMAMPANPWILRGTVACTFVAMSLLALFRMGAPPNLNAHISFLSSTCSDRRSQGRDSWIPPAVSEALLHYATTSITPQQNREEIRLSLKVLAERSPCNFLVFGLGHDSALWNALNYGGLTVFLEEDSAWMDRVRKSHPDLKAYHVSYPTNLTQADALMAYYSSDPSCGPALQSLPGSKCKLALTSLPEEIYKVEWDVIMIDAPRGYFDGAPGRMTAIFSAAVMARNRKKDGITHIFLHDVDRRVEKLYAEEFLCKENLLGASGRLWHFGIKPVSASKANLSFCNKSPR